MHSMYAYDVILNNVKKCVVGKTSSNFCVYGLIWW